MTDNLSGPQPTGARASGWLFAVTILVAAFLLFQVQPLVGKYILPWFGGSPAVWNAAMLFFQSLLFGGYLYAHLLQRWRSVRGQAAVHVLLIVAAVLALPIAPDASWKPADSTAPVGRILLLLTATVGLPYLALSATSPLIQSWFARACPGRSPYRLYALSNVGSLAALLSYPLLFEPALELEPQTQLWSWAFGAYGLACLLCAVSLWRLPAGPSVPVATGNATSPAADADARPSWWRRAAWVLLPAWGSLMLLATTNHVCQDIAVVPFLWVVPLALYLVTFIICFDHERWYVRRVWTTMAASLVLAVAAYEGGVFHDWWNFIAVAVLCFVALFCVCMVCHGELVRLRPAPRYLTEFYLLIAAGGALGGLFVSLIAPLVFRTLFEWPVGLAGAFLIASPIAVRTLSQNGWRRSLQAAVIPVMLPCLGLILYWEAESSSHEPLAAERNFYGVVEVYQYGDENDEEEPPRRYMWHGSIVHGMQSLSPEGRRLPTTYYGPAGGVGRALDYFRQREAPSRVGIVGLGVGTIAAYGRPNDYFRFYEINPAVQRFAQEQFTFLQDLQDRRGEFAVVLGDARLSLEREADQGYQLLVLDAFSGDAVPTHLLTTEAFSVYTRHIAPDGVIAVHVTNKYLRLTPVARKLAAEHGFQARLVRNREDEDHYLSYADWLLVTRNADFLKTLPAEPPGEAADDADVPLWTDHYSNLVQALRWTERPTE